MNKTVNINLGGTFFHIDEDAYNKLNRYLDTIRRSLSDPHGREEIIKDIEVRIAELFSEKINSEKQVVTTKELDDVIAVMGQPEDYAVDDELFDDSPSSSEHASQKSHKKLFRDPDDKYIAGVSSGLAHYLGIEAVWIRLIWVLITIVSGGTAALFYILFWILVPEAATVAEKLTMKGEPVNISNIEKKFKETYDSVADKVKNADYDKYGKKIKSGTDSFFEALGSFFMVLLTIFVKFIGVLLLLISGLTLVGLFIGLFISGISGFFGSWYSDFFHVVNDSIIPVWLLSITLFIAVGLPFFALFILGLKIVIPNLKPLTRVVKLSLIGLWIISVGALIAFSIRQAVNVSHTGSYVSTERLEIRPNDTVYVTMHTNRQFEREAKRRSGFSVNHNEAGEPVLYSNDIRLIVKSSKDSVGAVSIEKKAKGKSYKEARERAQHIDYRYDFTGKTLSLNGYFLNDIEQKYRGQEVEITLYLPIGSILNADKNTYSFHRNTSGYGDILHNGDEGYYLEILDGKTLCLDCPSVKVKTKTIEINQSEEEWDRQWEEGNKIKINRNGIDINVTDEKDSVQVKINRKGINIKSN